MRGIFAALIFTFLSTGCVKAGTSSQSSLSPVVSVQSLTMVNYNASVATLDVAGTVSGLTSVPFTQISFHLSPQCSDSAIGSGTSQTFMSSGIDIQVPVSGSSKIYFQTNIDSTCYYLTQYNPSLSPAAPVFSSTSPTSPSLTVYTPRIFGTVGAGVTQVNFYSDSACTVSVGTGTAADFSGLGIALTLPQNATTKIYGQAVDALSNQSVCTLLTSYTQNSSLPAAPTFTSISPASPSQSLTATISGQTTGTINDVLLFSDAACLNQLATGTPAAFSGTGLTVTVPGNATTSIYGEAVDSSGNSSPCGFLTAFTNDTIAPTAPAFSAASPPSPTRLTIYPAITGTTSSDTASVTLFSDASCKTIIGSGVRTQFLSSGITATVATNSTTTIYAEAFDSAGNSSVCTHLVDYVNNTVPPSPPTFTATTPASPNNVSMTPYVEGTVDPSVATVSLFSDAICTSQIGTGTGTSFMSTGIQVTVPANTTVTIYGEAIDQEGNVSSCNLLTDYSYSNLQAPAPVYTATTPSSPSRSSSTPYVQGTADSTIVTVSMYSDNLCTTQIGSGSRSLFVSGGIQVTVATNATTSVYAMATDIYGNNSACTFMTNYTHDNIPPVDPTFTSISPTSPNNTSGTPTVIGGDSADTSTLKLYDSSSCVSSIGSGPGSSFSTGITASVAVNGTTTIYAKAFDLAGNGSNCVFMASYTYDTLKPAKPNFGTVTPTTPSYTRNTVVKGTIGTSTDIEPISAVNIYSDSACTSLLASGTQSAFTGSGIPVVMGHNTITTVYGQTADTVGNVSTCQFFLNYNENDNGPGNMTANTQPNGSVIVNWDYDPNATGYIVKRALTSGGPYTIVNPDATSTTYTDTDTSNGVTYFYVVDAFNGTGQSNDSTEASATITISAPNAPQTLTATPSAGKVQLNWLRDNSELNFSVYRGTQSGGPYTLIASGLSTNGFQDSTVTNGTAYYYVVDAVNPAGQSGFSNEASAVPLTSPSPPIQVTGRWNGSAYVLTWSAPSYYTSFNIKRGTSSTSLFNYASVSGTTFTYSDTNPSTNYDNYYAITAVYGSSESVTSSQVVFRDASGTIVTANPGSNQVILSWNALMNANDYIIERSTQPGGPYTTLATTSLTNYTDSSASNGTTYYYTVTCDYSGSGLLGIPSSEVNATPQSNPLSGPTNLIVITSNFLPQLSWSAPAQFGYFNVYRASASSGPYSLIATTAAAAYTDTSPLTGMNYYEVTSMWGSNESSASNSVSFRNGVTTSLSVANGATSLTLTWNAVTNASSYQIWRATSASGPFTEISSSATGTSYTDSSVTTGQGYFYEIAAAFSDGTTGQFYSPSLVIGGMAGSSTIPSGVTITQSTSSSLSVFWAKVTNATSYKIYKSTISGGPYTLVSSTTSTSITVSGLSNATKYYIVVTAVVGGVESSISSEVSAETAAVLSAPTVSPGANSIQISWTSTLGSSSVDLQRSTDKLNFTTVASGLTGLTYTDSTASNGTQYYYRTKPNFSSVSTVFYSPVSAGVTPGVTPIAPAGLTVTSNASGTSVTLSWGDVPAPGPAGSFHYNVKQATVSGGPYSVATTATSGEAGTTITGLTANTAYYFVVSAVNGSLESANSSEISVVPLATPTAPTVQIVGNTTISVSWSAVSCAGSNAISYDVLRSSNMHDFTSIATGISSTSYSDTAYVSGTAYTYEYIPHCTGNIVTAVSSASSPPVTPGIAPPAPYDVVANATTSTSVTLTWAGAAAATPYTYNIYRGTASGGPYSLVGSSGTSSYTDSGLAAGNYYYVVTTVNPSNIESAKSSEVSITLNLPAPSSLAATQSGNAIQLSWSSVTGAASYEVKRGVTSGGPYGQIASGIAATTYTDSTAAQGQTYYYVVTAVTSGGLESPNSPQASASAASLMNLQVPIELTDQGLSSLTGMLTFESTQTSLDTAAYDGTVTYYFEITATNSDSSARNVNLVDSSSAVIGTISVPGSQSAPIRLRTSVTPDSGSNIYRVQLAGTSSSNQLQVLSARLLVNQVNATKTKIYIPLLSSSAAPSSGDASSPIENTASATYVSLNSATLYQRSTSNLATLDAYNAWEVETVASVSGGATGAVVLNNDTQSTTIADTETLFTSGSLTLAESPFDEGTSGFGPANEGNNFELQMMCVSGCSAGSISLYKAGLWVSLSSLTKAEVYYRSALANSIATSLNIVQERTLTDTTVFSNPSVYFQAVADAGGGSSTAWLESDGTADSGTSSLSAITNSQLNFTGSGKTVLRSGVPLTITSGNRFISTVNTSSGTTNLNSSFIVIDATQ